jgi:hypothetical protein
MDFLTSIGAGAIPGSDMFDSFLHPEKGYEKGQEQLDKYYQQGQGYLNPYNQFGQDAHGNLSEAMKRLLDPAALQGDWIKSYSQSPAALNAAAMAKESGLDAASSMGLMGSNTALSALQGGASKIALDDRQNYLNDLMNKYLAGAGIAGNIFNTGANAAGQMSQNAMGMGGNSAQMAFGQQNAPGDLFGKLLGTAVGAASGGKTGGGGGWSFGGK